VHEFRKILLTSQPNQTEKATDLALDLLSMKALYRLEDQQVLVQPFAGNRLQEIKRLYAAGVSNVSTRDRLEWKQVLTQKGSLHSGISSKIAPTNLSTHAQLLQRQQQQALDTILQPKTTEMTTKATTTLQQRVEARAASARVSSDKEASSNHPKTDHVLRLADRLWSHACLVRRQQTRLQALSPRRQNSNNNSPVVLTVQDLVTSDLAPSNLVPALRVLQLRVPSWIVLSNNTTITKHSTLWIHDVEDDYARIRQELSKGGTSVISTTRKQGKQKVTPAKPAVTLTNTHYHVTTPQRPLAAILPKLTPQDSTSATPGATIKRKSEDSAQICEPTKRSKTGSQQLRINPHLILTDADYLGGEEIVINNTMASPRGLKQLFRQLNARQRI
jgi:hypothetical protein